MNFFVGHDKINFFGVEPSSEGFADTMLELLCCW